MKIKRVVLTALLLFSVLPMLAVAGICVGGFTHNSIYMAQENVRTAAMVQAKHLENFFEQREVNLKVAARLPSVLQFTVESNRAEPQMSEEEYRAYQQMVSEVLQIRQEEQDFLIRMSLVNRDNIVIASSDAEMVGEKTLMPVDYAQQLRANRYVVSSVEKSDRFLSGQKHFVVACPVLKDGEYQGTMIYAMNMHYFERLLEDTGFFETGTFIVLDGNGTVAATSSPYLGDRIDQIGPANTLTEQIEQIRSQDGESGLFDYSIDNINKIGCYSKIADTGWVVISAVDWSEFMAPIQDTILLILGLLVLVVFLVIVLFLYASRVISKPMNQLITSIRQLQKGDASYRVEYDQKNEFGEIGAAFNDLMDQVARDNEALRTSEERYRIVSELSENVIFEYNMQDDSVFHSHNWLDKFGYTPITHDFIQEAIDRKIVHPDDQETFQTLFTELKNGRKSGGVDLRIRIQDGSYIWCSVQATTIFSDDGKPLKVVGKLTDIDERKRETETLLSRAQRDTLTGLYNKGTAERLISSCLAASQPGDMHALFAIDVDNFKAVNDNLGHLFGDAVLSEISSKITGQFRSSDIVGRIGGDEFVVFLKNLRSLDLVYEKAEAMIDVFRHSFTGQNMDYKISGSIGIALYPRDGKTYPTLFKNADNALYCAKNQGKDGFRIYDDSIEEAHYALELEQEEKRDEAKPFRDHVSEYIFQILYEAKDVRSAVRLILDIVGRYYNVSRAYVFENSEDDLYCNNTFEWCNEGIEPQAHRLQKVPYRFIGDYESNFNEDGIFYCADISTLPENLYGILAPQGIHSMLQCAILNDGKFKGYVGFDECRDYRLWTKEEIGTLTFISKILSTFLLKMRAQDRLEKSYQITKTVLDTQDMWTYVIRKNTYELLFINKKTKELAPDAQVGDRCYHAFWGGRESPCEVCPMKGIDRDHDRCTMEIYNTTFHVWTSATAAKMNWTDDSEVYLLCCTDITRYKRRENLQDPHDGEEKA